MKKTFVIDMDGTICTQQRSGEYELAQPIQKMIEKINSLYDAGNMIIIFTARGMNSCNGDVFGAEQMYYEETESWLHANGVKFDRLIFGKPAADYYIDDKGMTPDDFISHDFD